MELGELADGELRLLRGAAGDLVGDAGGRKVLQQQNEVGAVGRSDNGSLYARIAPRSLSDKMAQLGQVMSTDRAGDH